MSKLPTEKDAARVPRCLGFADLAKVGDAIETTVRHPCRRVIRLVLATPESVAYANSLLLSPNSGWRRI